MTAKAVEGGRTSGSSSRPLEGVARHAVDPRSALALVFVRCAGPISRPGPMRRVSSLESALFKE